MTADGEARPELDRDAVRHVARLARLELDDAEVDRFTSQLGSVLDHARDIAGLDLTEVPPTAHPQPLRNVLRDDEVVPGLSHEEALAGAPEVEEGRFKVPRILGEAP